MRVASLTGLRGVAAVSVLLYHIPHQPAFTQFAIPLFSRAYLAVDLFFILSGFVLTWVARPGEPRRRFYRRRLVKIFPNHIVTWTAGL